MEKQENTRILWLDILRVTAIFAMVTLHVFTGNFLGQDSCWRSAPPAGAAWQILNVYDCLLRFCVPVFCMISGVFFLDPEREQPFRKLFSKNISRIVRVYIVWAAVYAAAGALLRAEAFGKAMLVDMAKSFVFGHYHLWFLLMLLGFYLIVPLLRRITADRKLTVYFLLLSFVFCCLQNAVQLLPGVGNVAAVQGGKLSLYFVTGYTGYFVLGSYLFRFPPKPKTRRLIYGLGVLSLILTVLAAGWLSYSRGTAVDSLYGYLLPNTLFESAAVFLWFQTHFGGRKYSARSARHITALSACSFGVYLVHDLFNMLLHRCGVTALSFIPALAVPLLAAAVCAVSLLPVYLLRRLPFFRKYLL